MYIFTFPRSETQSFQLQLLIKTYFSIKMSLFLCQESVHYICQYCFLVLCSILLIHVPIYFYQYYTILIITALSGKMNPPNLFFYQYCIGYSMYIVFAYILQNHIVSTYTIDFWDFDQYFIESRLQVGKKCHFNL